MLHGGVGDVYRRGGVAANADTSLALAADANHLIVDAVDDDELAQGIFIGREELLDDAAADGAHLAALVDIHIVQGTSLAYFGVVYLIYIRELSLDGHIRLVGAIGSRTSPIRDGGRDDFQFGHRVANQLYVTCLDRPHAPLLETLVCLAGGRCHHEARVVGEPSEVVGEGGFQPSSASHQQQEHEHAPEDAERCQERAGLVASEGAEYLTPLVAVES